MKPSTATILVLAFSLLSFNALAEQAGSELGSCLTDSLTGKERKELAKWIFFGIAAHSEISTYASITPKDQTQTNETVGRLITRLLTEDCPGQTRAAFKESDTQAIQHAFGMVGQVAISELMTEPNVSKSLSGFEKYLDLAKLNALAKP